MSLALLAICLIALPLSAAAANTTFPISLNGEMITLENSLQRDENGRLLIASPDAAQLLGCRLDMVDNNQVQFNREEVILSLRVGTTDALVDGQLTSIAVMPQKIDEIIYVPLRIIAELYGFGVVYDARHGAVQLYSPGVTAPPPPVEVSAAEPPQHLPTWGRIIDTAGLNEVWPGEILIGSYYTTLISSPAGRTKNIELSCSQINETVLQPDQVFSFNQTSGPRTSTLGYQTAPIFVGKKVVPGIGGGVCQTSSTLYNCALDAGLEVVQRYRHTLPVAYVAPGRDATVSWGGADLQFRNNHDTPVKILARVWDKYVLCGIAEVH